MLWTCGCCFFLICIFLEHFYDVIIIYHCSLYMIYLELMYFNSHGIIVNLIMLPKLYCMHVMVSRCLVSDSLAKLRTRYVTHICLVGVLFA